MTGEARTKVIVVGRGDWESWGFRFGLPEEMNLKLVFAKSCFATAMVLTVTSNPPNSVYAVSSRGNGKRQFCRLGTEAYQRCSVSAFGLTLVLRQICLV